MRFTNWDKYKDDKSICEGLGCDEDARWFCCPDLDGMLCIPKKEWLKDSKIAEEDLDSNLISHKIYFK